MNRIPTKVASPIAKQEAPAIITKFPDPVFEGEVAPSIIHPELSGEVMSTGFRGKGKTSLALKWDNPNNIIMIDCEDKGKTLAQQRLEKENPFKVGAYFQPMTEAVRLMGSKLDIQAVYDRIIQIVEKAPAGRFTTLVLDNASFLQDGAAQAVRKDPVLAQRYGVRPENAITGGFGGAWPAVKYMIRVLNHLINEKGIKIFNVCFQLKEAWKDGKPVFNKFQTTNVATWHELSVLTLVLVDPMPEHFPNPRALVMKESLSTMTWNPETNRTEQVRRIPPALPIATPYEIYNYLDNPYDPRDPKPGETVTALELAPFTPTFSNEQLYLLERMVRAQKELGMGAEEGNE